MYSRNYYTEAGEKINVPENYDGVTFSIDESKEEAAPQTAETSEVSAEPKKNPWEALPPPVPQSHENETEKRADGILAGLTGVPFLGRIFGKGMPLGLSSLRLPKIGTEEILIIGAAIFLFFSKDGDRECALILLLLLLIN